MESQPVAQVESQTAAQVESLQAGTVGEDAETDATGGAPLGLWWLVVIVINQLSFQLRVPAAQPAQGRFKTTFSKEDLASTFWELDGIATQQLKTKK